MGKFILGVILYALVCATACSQDDYRLGPSDKIAMAMFQEPDMDTTVRITEGGEASFPLIGAVELQGLTLKEAETKLTDLYEVDLFVSPKVSLNLIEAALGQVTILGAVRSPGAVELPVGGKITLVTALASVGGLTEAANPNKIEVKQGDKVFTVSYESLNEAGAKVVHLRAGDIVDVAIKPHVGRHVTVMGLVANPGRVAFPQSGKLDIKTAIDLVGGFEGQADRSSITVRRNGVEHMARIGARLLPDDIVMVNPGRFAGESVFVSGRVGKPGRVAIPPEGRLSILDAIAEAGNFDRLARKTKVRVTRNSPDGLETINVNVQDIERGKEENFFLLPGDKVHVPERWF